MQRALDVASCHGHDAVLLVGDEAYYRRFGFSANTAPLTLAGADPARPLACELKPGALDGAHAPHQCQRRTHGDPRLPHWAPASQHAAGLLPHAA